jgi:hypothetical protein
VSELTEEERQRRLREMCADYYAAGRRDALREAVGAIKAEALSTTFDGEPERQGFDNAARVVAGLGEVGE